MTDPGAPAKVGFANAFTAHYTSVKVMVRFLQNLGHEVVETPRTTPEILTAGTTLASADFCIPLRAYVGHVHYLVTRHPDVKFILCPNVSRENPFTSTCSKYRDVGGVALRSISNSVGYTVRYAPPGKRERLARLMGREELMLSLEGAANFPSILQPTITSMDRVHLRNTCFGVWSDLIGLPRRRAIMEYFAPKPLARLFSRHLAAAGEAFEAAYTQVTEERNERFERFMSNGESVRVALVGRDYLTEDHLITCDLKPFLRRSGAQILTAKDVPFEHLRDSYMGTPGFHDTHRLFSSFVEFASRHVDGFVLVGSFGCHPDAFMMEMLLDDIRAKGYPAWLFKYDEQSGSAGFKTRYETVMGFLEKRRDQRLGRGNSGDVPDAPPAPLGRVDVSASTGLERRSLRPLIVWPHMNSIVDMIVNELFHQAGLSEYLYGPSAATEETMELGDYRYIEACCPFAITNGSLRETLTRCLKELEDEARSQGRPVESRRILMLQGRGEGPCVYGWYSIIQAREMLRLFEPELRRHGHTLEMATMGLTGAFEFITELSKLGNARNLAGILRFIEAQESGALKQMSGLKRLSYNLGLMSSVKALTKAGWQKIDAVESLRARSLIIRAHEKERGQTTRTYNQCVRLVSQAHTPEDVASACRDGHRLLDEIDTDSAVKPRVVVVGEIYVATCSFANRGTVENILGRQGIEVVEGITLGAFLRDSIYEMKRRGYINRPVIKPVLERLGQNNIYLFNQRVRGRFARPFALHEVGGEGIKSVAEARKAIEEGVDGVVHVYPFKCMPEGVVKDAIAEVCDFYGVRYLPLSFGRETEIERLKTELTTFGSLLSAQAERLGASDPDRYRRAKCAENGRRREMGALLTGIYDQQRTRRFLN